MLMLDPTEIRNTLQRAHEKVAKTGKGHLLSLSLPWEAGSLTTFLKIASGVPRIYWNSTQDPVGFSGHGVAAVLKAAGPERFQTIRRKASRLFNDWLHLGSQVPAVITPRLFGGFAFEPDPELKSFWAAFSAASFILPRYQLTQTENETWLTVNHQLRPENNPDEIAYLFDEVVHALETASRRIEQSGAKTTPVHPAQQTMALDELMDRPTWRRLVGAGIRKIQAGDLQKVVFARARHLHAGEPLDPVGALLELELRYPDCYRFLFEPVSGHAFYGATPELLAKVSGSELHTVALAGSIRRGETEAEDAALGERLLKNPKERHEHALVVEAVEKILDKLVEALAVSPQPGLRKLGNIQHLETQILAKLRDPQGVLPVIEALHPTPAVGGVPRDAALELIHRSEPFQRGWYAAPVGWMDPNGDGLFTVAIRSAITVGSQTRLFAGAGIVGDSQPDREWQEIELKFRPLMEALRAEGHREPAQP